MQQKVEEIEARARVLCALEWERRELEREGFENGLPLKDFLWAKILKC